MGATTNTTLTLNLLDKSAVYTSKLGVGEETIAVDIVGYGAAVQTDLELYVTKRGVTYASCKVFTVKNGTTYTGNLNLNQVALVALFANSHWRNEKNFEFTLWDKTNKCMLLNQRLPIMNNPIVKTATTEAEGALQSAIADNGDTDVIIYDKRYWNGAFVIGTLSDGTIKRFYKLRIWHTGTTPEMDYGDYSAQTPDFAGTISLTPIISTNSVILRFTLAGVGSILKFVHKPTVLPLET